MTLAEFLNARLDEDEAVATRIINADESLAAGRARSMLIYACWDEAAHVALGAGRVLAEVDAKRRMVDLHEPKVITWPKAHGMDPYIERLCTECGTGMRSWGPGDPAEFEPVDWPCPTLRLLALPYADSPDYDEAWRPGDEGAPPPG